MVKCSICEGEAPKKPGVTDEGKCDQCGKKLEVAKGKK